MLGSLVISLLIASPIARFGKSLRNLDRQYLEVSQRVGDSAQETFANSHIAMA